MQCYTFFLYLYYIYIRHCGFYRFNVGLCVIKNNMFFNPLTYIFQMNYFEMCVIYTHICVLLFKNNIFGFIEFYTQFYFIEFNHYVIISKILPYAY